MDVSEEGVGTEPHLWAWHHVWEEHYDESNKLNFTPSMPFPPPWYVPVEAPACNAVLDVAAGVTNDGIARKFYCDRQAGHPDNELPTEKHRAIYDPEEGRALWWEDRKGNAS